MRTSTITFFTALLAGFLAWLGAAETARGQCLPPSSLTAAGIDYDSGEVMWLSPGQQNGNFVYQIKKVSDPNWGPETFLPDTTTSKVFNNLEHSTCYMFRIKFECLGGNFSQYTAPVTFCTNCIGFEADAGPDQTICQGDTAFLNGNVLTAAIGQWQIQSAPSSPLLQPAGIGEAVVYGFNLPGNYFFTYVIPDTVCGFRADTMQVTVADTAYGGYAYGDSVICSGDSVYLTLANYFGNIVGWEYSSNNFATWNFLNNPAPTALFAPTQNMQYRAVVVGACGDTTYSNIGEVLVNNCNNNCANVHYPAFYYDMGGRCPGDTVTFYGSKPQSGSQYYQFLSGPATAINTGNPHPSPVFNHQHTRVFNMGNLPGDYYFVYIVQDSLCGTFTDTLKVTVNNCGNNCANFYADAGPDQTVCTGYPIYLNGNVVSGAQMMWSYQSGPTFPQVVNDTPGGASVYGATIPGTYNFVYEVYDSICGAAVDTMQVVVGDSAIGGYAYGDSSVCSGDSVYITLANYYGNIIGWEYSNDYFVTTNYTNNNAQTALFVAMQNTQYRAVVVGACGDTTYSSIWEVNVQNCGNNCANFRADAGPDQTVCSGWPIYLQGNYRPNAWLEWKQLNGPATVNPINDYQGLGYINNTSGMLPGTYTFTYEVDDSLCGYDVDTMQVMVGDTAYGGSAYGDTTVCAGDSINILLANYYGNVAGWQVYESNSSSWTSIYQQRDRLTYVANIDAVFRAVVISDCGDTTYSSLWDVVVNDCNCANFTADAGPDQEICYIDSVVLQGNVVQGAQMQWEWLTGPNQVSVNDLGNGGASVNNGLFPNSTHTFRYIVVDPACGTAYDDVQVTVVDWAMGGWAGYDTTICSGDSVTIYAANFYGDIQGWEYSTDNFSTSNFMGVSNNPLHIGPLTQNMQFRTVIDNACGVPARSTIAEIEVENCADCSNFYADAGPNRTICQNDTAWIRGNHISGAYQNWSYIGGPQPAPIYNSFNFDLLVTDFNAPGVYTFAYTLYDSTCGAHTDTMRINVLPAPDPGYIMGDSVLCGADSASLWLAQYSGNIVGWEYATGNFSNPLFVNYPYNTITLPVNQPTRVRALVANQCDTVYTQYFHISASGQNANVTGILYGDTAHCSAQNQGRVELWGNTGTIVGWEVSFDGFQTSFPFNWTNNYFNYYNLGFDLSFRVKVTDGVCTYTSNEVTIYVDSMLTYGGYVYGDSTICAGDSIYLQVANNPAPVLQWEVSTDNFATYNVIGGNQPWLLDAPAQNKQYRVKIGASGSCVAYSNIWNVTVQNCCPAPDWVSVDSVLYSEAQVNWGQALGNNVTAYDVYYRPSGQSNWIYRTRANSGPVWLNGLNPDTQYEVKVVTLCGNDFSPEVADTFRTLRQQCYEPQNLRVDSVAVNWALVSWNPSPGANRYSLRYRAVGTNTWQTVTINGTSTWLSGLMMNTEYEVQVRSLCGNGNNSSWTYRRRFTTGPGVAVCPAPTSLHADSVTHNSAVLNWAPAGNVSGYEVRYREQGSLTWSSLAFTSSTHYPLNGLDEGTTYEFQARSVCGNSFSQFSGLAIFTTETLAATGCQPPTQNLTITTTATTAKLQWNHVPGYVVYIVYYRAKGTAAWKINSTVNNFINLSGLNPNTNYEVQMKTYCLNGVSDFSPIINLFTTFNRAQVIDGAETGLALRVYPNPNQGRFTVEIEAPEGETIHLKLSDVTGRTVLARDENVHTGINEIPVEISGYAPGVYLLQLDTASGAKHVKVVLE